MTERVLECDVFLAAPVCQVWRRWTTEEGIKSFFAAACNLELRPDGAYEIFFFPENPAGMRGADGQRVMAIEEEKMFSFTWNFTPDLPDIRDQRTLVVLRFREENKGTRLSLTQFGWGEGPLWQKGYDYFSYAWPCVVFQRLKYSLEKGPIDWSNPPELERCSG